MGGAPGERAGFHEGGQTAVTVSGNGAHRAIPAHLSGRSLLVRRAPVASRGMIRGVYTFQAGVALTTLNQEFWKFVRTDGPIVAISISIREEETILTRFFLRNLLFFLRNELFRTMRPSWQMIDSSSNVDVELLNDFRDPL